jgi:hypothetical protein
VQAQVNTLGTRRSLPKIVFRQLEGRRTCLEIHPGTPNIRYIPVYSTEKNIKQKNFIGPALVGLLCVCVCVCDCVKIVSDKFSTSCDSRGFKGG